MEAEAPLNGVVAGEKVKKEDKKRQSRRANAFQLMACFIANTSVIGPAMGLGYSAVALGPLSSPNSGIQVSSLSTRSWIASITAIATPIGCMLASVSMRRGRRFALISTSVVSVIAWLSIYFAANVTHVLIGRAISGVAIGLASVPATVYAAEVAAPKLRGIVVTWTSVAIAIGILIVYTLGYFLEENWRLMALLSSVFPALSMVLVLWKLPESPVWLRARGRTEESERVLREFQGLVGEEPRSEKPLVPVSGQEAIPGSSRIFTVSNLKPFSIMIGYFFFQQFSGTFVVIYYAVDITLEAGVGIDGNLAAILIGIARLLGTIFVSYVCRKLGRRIPSILSGTGMTLFMGILSGYLWAISRGYIVGVHGWIPVLSILMYILSSTLGFLVLPFAMIGELYPARVKDIFSGMTTCLAYVFSFIVLKIHPDMVIAFDKHGVFFFYTILSFLGTVFVLLFLPETKGKTLQQIEESFKSKNTIGNNAAEKNFTKEMKTITVIRND